MADQLGLPRTKVIECINLTKLREDIQELIQKNSIVSRDILREIVSLKDADMQIEYIKSKLIPNQSVQSSGKLRSLAAATSIIRISMQDYRFNVQKKGLSKMSLDHKSELKEILTGLIEEL